MMGLDGREAWIQLRSVICAPHKGMKHHFASCHFSQGRNPHEAEAINDNSPYS